MFLKNLFQISRRNEICPATTSQRVFVGSDKLFDDILKKGTLLRVTVTGTSMGPMINSGDVVTICQWECWRLKTGDLIFFRDLDGFPVLHRLIRRIRPNGSGKSLLVTKGDALLGIDIPVGSNRLLGKVIRIEKRSGAGNGQVWDLNSGSWRWINFLTGIFFRMKLRINSE